MTHKELLTVIDGAAVTPILHAILRELARRTEPAQPAPIPGEQPDDSNAIQRAAEWRYAVVDACTEAGIDAADDGDPRELVKRLLDWISKVALDPAASKDAKELHRRVKDAEWRAGDCRRLLKIAEREHKAISQERDAAVKRADDDKQKYVETLKVLAAARDTLRKQADDAERERDEWKAKAEQPRTTELLDGWRLYERLRPDEVAKRGRFTLERVFDHHDAVHADGQEREGNIRRVDALQPTPESLGLERVTGKHLCQERPYILNGMICLEWHPWGEQQGRVPIELFFRRLPAPEPKADHPVNADGVLNGLWRRGSLPYRITGESLEYWSFNKWNFIGPIPHVYADAMRRGDGWTRTDDDPERPWQSVETPPEDDRDVEAEWPDGKDDNAWRDPDGDWWRGNPMNQSPPPLRWRELRKGGAK